MLRMRLVVSGLVLGVALTSTAHADEADAGVDELLRVSAAATTGTTVVAQPLVTDVADQLTLVPVLHGDVELVREAGTFQASGRISLLATAAPMPTVTDLGSYVGASVRLHRDATLSVRVLPFAPRQALRVPFDLANDFGWPSVLFGELPFAPTLVTSVGAGWWHASLSAAASVAPALMPPPRPHVAVVPRFVAEIGAERESVRIDLRVGAVELDRSFFRLFEGPPGRIVGALRVGWRTGDVGRPIDLLTYRDDPDRFVHQFAAVPAPAYRFEAEVEAGAADAMRDGAKDTTVDFPWFLQVRLAAMLLHQRVFATLRVRSAAQLRWISEATAGVGAPGYIDLSEPAIIMHLATDRRFGPLTLGAGLRVARPGVQVIREDRTLTSGFFEEHERWISGVDGRIQEVPIGFLPRLRVGMKVTARLELGSHVTLLGEFDTDTVPAQPSSRKVPLPADRQAITAHVFVQVR